MPDPKSGSGMFDDLLEEPAPTVTPAPRKTETEQERCVIAQAAVIQVFLKTIAGDSHWTNRLAALLAEHPDVPVRTMGFPEQWHEQALWKAG